MNKRLLTLSFRIIVSVALLAIVFAFVDTASLLESFRNVKVPFLLVAALFFGLHVVTWAKRWHLLLRDSDVDVSLLQTTKTVLFGFTVALFLPSAAGTDVGRVYDMAKSREQKVAILSTVFMDRLIGLITIIGTALVAIAVAGYQYLNDSILIAIVATAIVMVLGWVFFFNKGFMRNFRWALNLPIVNRFADSLRELYTTVYDIQRKPKLFAGALLVSVISTMFELLAIIMLAYALDAVVSLVFYFLFVPIIWVILVLPVSIGGLGLRESVFAFFFTQVGMTTTDAFALSLLYYSLTVVAGIIGGVIPAIDNILSALETRQKPKRKQDAKSTEASSEAAPQPIIETEV